jgi:tetratricopeptide (TPR) repeat protein
MRGLVVPSIAAFCVLLAGCGKLGSQDGVRKPPNPPAVIAAKGVEKGVEITWPAVPLAKHYTVFWGTEQGEYRGLVNTTESTLLLTGLRKGELYYFAVTSWGDHGESSYSPELAFLDDDDSLRAAEYLAKGTESMNRGSYSDADAYLSLCIRLDPTNAAAYRSRARLYERMSRTDLARQDSAMAEKLFRTRAHAGASNG